MNQKVMDRIREHYVILCREGYEVVYLGLQGSQNYGLDIYENSYLSDVDSKAIVLPTFEDFVENRPPVGFTKVLDNNEHIDVKDIRVMFENFKKQNINFIEILFTEYALINSQYFDEITYLLDGKEKIARMNVNQALRCMAGISKEKLKALQHPYPATLDKIEKFGYDPKQLYHILRMNDFIRKYIAEKPYSECLIPDEKEYLISIKKGALSCDTAVKLAKLVDESTFWLKDKNVLENDIINNEAVEILRKVKYDILKKRFKKQILEEEKECEE